MITLFSFGPHFGLSEASPFVLKVDLYLRMNGIEFESNSDFKNFRQAPKGKLPYIKDNETIVADSFFIIEYLREKYSSKLDEHLSEQQQATAHLLTKSIDENFYWCLIYFRWISDKYWPGVKAELFKDMPFPLKYIVPFIARRSTKNAIMNQGIGRHTESEILDIAEQTLSSLSTLLADQDYFFGDKPSTFDATAYAFLAQATLSNQDTPLTKTAKKKINLVNYCQRIQSQHYA